MIRVADSRLARLLQLASPALPVGAYSYSQGLEAAVEAGIVFDARSAQSWIADVLAFSLMKMEAPLFLRLCAAWQSDDLHTVEGWNMLFLASRETAELRAETTQMGYSLHTLMIELDAGEIPLAEVAFPTVFAHAVVRWEIEPESALIAYLWAWLENQVMAAIKVVPLGQTDGQKILLALGSRLDALAAEAATLADDELGNLAPGLALLSSGHETQYSRLFRS
jgi:urease accessory protein